MDQDPKNEDKQEFLLFVSGMSVKSVRAMENIHTILDEYLSNRYTLKIIDINREREQVAQYQIVAIPTLIRCYPEPKRILVGDLSNTEKIINYLAL